MLPLQFTTIFEQPIRKKISVWTIVFTLLILALTGMVLFTFLMSFPIVGLSVIIIFIIFLVVKMTNNSSTVLFIERNVANSDFYFGFRDGSGKTYGHELIEEFTYWCHETGYSMQGHQYQLVVMLKSANRTIFLKEQCVVQSLPEGWEIEEQNIPDGTDVISSHHLFHLVDTMNFSNLINVIP